MDDKVEEFLAKFELELSDNHTPSDELRMWNLLISLVRVYREANHKYANQNWDYGHGEWARAAEAKALELVQ